MVDEKYEFEVDEDGLDYDILDYAFNKTTKSLLKKHLKLGMKVLDVGCGSGVMTEWLSEMVGPTGLITSIDNSKEQLKHAERRIKSKGLNNVQFKLLSVYDLGNLEEKFDMVYCRFVFHHVFSPREVIDSFYGSLKDNGVYIAEEGIISSAFSYPHTDAWQCFRPSPKPLSAEQDGESRDGDFGMKLFYNMKKSGFKIVDTRLIQPLLTTYEEKLKLMKNKEAFKKTALEQGTTEQEWAKDVKALQSLIDDDFSIAGFYQSCQVAGVK